MSTPEGKVKQRVKAILKEYGEDLDQFWPVQNGMGTPALDCICCYMGIHFEIETKAPGKRMTPRQKVTAAQKHRAGAVVFEIDGEVGYNELKAYLSCVKANPLAVLLEQCNRG